jgi:hypothetical protein
VFGALQYGAVIAGLAVDGHSIAFRLSLSVIPDGRNPRIIACNATNLLHCLSLVYSVTTHLHVSGLLVAHHQEVTVCVCNSWYVLSFLVDCQRAANSQLKRTAGTNCHIYTLLPPDDGQLASPKHVAV